MREKLIAAVPAFEGLTPDERRRVARCSRLATFEPGDTVVEERRFSYELFAIVEGAAAVFRDGGEVARLGPGDFFGELGVFPRGSLKWGRRSATVVAGTRLTALVIAGIDARDLVREIPALGEAIAQAAGERDPSMSSDIG